MCLKKKKLEYDCFTVLLVSNLQQSVSAICFIYLSPPSWTSRHPTPSHPSRSLQSAELGPLCYIAISHYLSVLHVVVRLHIRFYYRYLVCLGDLPGKSLTSKQTANAKEQKGIDGLRKR